jgi:hypothetical protein
MLNYNLPIQIIITIIKTSRRRLFSLAVFLVTVSLLIIILHR